jgi:hypothetical protein
MITLVVVCQWLGKHDSVTTDTHSTVEELLGAVFSVQSMRRLYSEHVQDKSVRRESTTGAMS